MWIGYRLLDRTITYPDVPFLSRRQRPIQNTRGLAGARLLAVLTLQCAAKPYWWHGGQPAQVAISRVNVRMKGPRPPPIG